MTGKAGIMIVSAPNGARRTKSDHPLLPLTAREIARTARSCLAAGASILHLHVRDASGAHSLDPELYTRAISAIDRAVGDAMIIQVTSEAAGRYSSDEQMRIIDILRPEAVSLALREIIPDSAREVKAAAFLARLAHDRIWPQFILYDADDLARFISFYRRGLIPFAAPFLLFVLGQYGGREATPEDLDPFLETLHGRNWPWMVCAFGRNEAACMARAAGFGGHMRVGFENNIMDKTGRRVADNDTLVKQASRIARKSGRPVLDAVEIRNLVTKWVG